MEKFIIRLIFKLQPPTSPKGKSLPEREPRDRISSMAEPKQLENLITEAINILNNTPKSVSELALEMRLSEEMVREIVWKLINRRMVNFNKEWKLVLESQYKTEKKLKTRAELVKLYNNFGFTVQKTDKFYKIEEGKNVKYGLKVGQHEHSCHIDSTDIQVLFILDEDGRGYYEGNWGLWLKEVF